LRREIDKPGLELEVREVDKPGSGLEVRGER